MKKKTFYRYTKKKSIARRAFNKVKTLFKEVGNNIFQDILTPLVNKIEMHQSIEIKLVIENKYKAGIKLLHHINEEDASIDFMFILKIKSIYSPKYSNWIDLNDFNAVTLLRAEGREDFINRELVDKIPKINVFMQSLGEIKFCAWKATDFKSFLDKQEEEIYRPHREKMLEVIEEVYQRLLSEIDI